MRLQHDLLIWVSFECINCHRFRIMSNHQQSKCNLSNSGNKMIAFLSSAGLQRAISKMNGWVVTSCKWHQITEYNLHLNCCLKSCLCLNLTGKHLGTWAGWYIWYFWWDRIQRAIWRVTEEVTALCNHWWEKGFLWWEHMLHHLFAGTPY